MGKKHCENSQAQKASKAVAKSFVSDESLKADPSGSYTGHPRDKNETPEQDADDL